MREAIDAMRDAFGQLSGGRAELPLRASITVPRENGVALVMSARCDVPFGLGAKFVTVYPWNPEAGRPLVHGAVLLFDPETGVPAALLEGTALTALRTGAASGLATELLARGDATRVAVIGSGAQARTQLEAVCCVRRVESVAVYSIDQPGAERFVQEMAGNRGVPRDVEVVGSAREAAREADIVCTATSSAEPVLGPDDVASGVHINAIGSFTPEMQEIDPSLIGGARVFVDQRRASLAESGEIIAAVRDGLIEERELFELGEIVNGEVRGRVDDAQITLFKSVGVAVQDLCAGARALERAAREGLGVEVEF